jgi:GNAT superfamily N-acetyltransferase
MSWAIERKREACLRASMGRALLRPDTVIIERPGWYQVMTPSASGTANEVVFSQVDDADADTVIANNVAAYRVHGRATKWCVGYWTKPADFGERLVRHGFAGWDVRGMGCASSLALSVPSRVSVEEVTESNLDAYVAVALRGWSIPAAEGEIERGVHLAALGAVPRAAFFFVARLDGEIVGTAALVLRGDYGYLLGTQVLEGARGQGVYRALVAARLSFLRARGLGYAVTQAREATSAPMLEHLGFETLFRSKCYLLR